MIGDWIRAHRSLAGTTVAGVVVAAVLAGVAVTSDGYSAQRMDLGDASVWVAGGSERHVGRANTAIAALDTAVPVESTTTDIVQNGRAVVAVDRLSARADILDPVTATVTKTVPLPPEQPDLFLTGSTAAVFSGGTGQLWVLPFEALTDFSADEQETLNLGAGTLASATPDGNLVSFTPSTGQVRFVDLARGGAVRDTIQADLSGDAADMRVTAVGDHWAVLDTASRQIEVDGNVMDVRSALGSDDGTLALQRPSATGSGILVASESGLARVPFSGGGVTVLVDGLSGTAAEPVVAGDCVFAAWTASGSWRSCAGAASGPTVLDAVAGDASLKFQANGDHLVLNDVVSGASWAVQADVSLIDNWSELIDADSDEEVPTDSDPDSDPVVAQDQAPPTADDDEFGARPGRTTVLPVLLNDSDPNGDVLVISDVEGADPAVALVEEIDERQRLQVTLPANARGAFALRYTVDDGRGGSDRATVTVTVHDDDENSPPRQVRRTTGSVAAGSSATLTAVLADWVDPDGDPFYLESAEVRSPDRVTYTAAGSVRISASSGSDGRLTVPLVVSDGSERGSGSIVAKVVVAKDLALYADPFVVIAPAGQPVTIEPLDHVHGRSGPVRLNAVPPRSGSDITPRYDAGTFVFESDIVRTHYISYVVTDDDSTATGVVRVEVVPPPDPNATPVTTPKTVFVRSLSTASVDIAGTDVDPAGGVLLVTSVDPAPDGVSTELIDQRSVRVTLTAPLSGSESFGYTVSNGLASAQGTVSVVEIPTPDVQQPPIARDDVATARVGDAITIDVLANDEQPDDLPFTLDPALVDPLTGASGLLFVSGNTLRYLAPDHPGNFVGAYQISGPDGQVAQAEVRIQVREVNADSNRPPIPGEVTARVLAGQSVRIPIPLGAIDPDGDSVQLLGQATNPAKGAVTSGGTDYLEYTAGEYSAGTDEFSYTVIDALGARATGTVRVGISARLAGARNPVATRDDVVARPGTAVSVQVLENDSDPDGGELTVVSVEPTTDNIAATIDDDSVVTVDPPSEEGDYGVVYTIENDEGGTSSAFVVVHVENDAPLSYPVLGDTVLTLADIVGRETVDVDVLGDVFFAEGDPRSLGVSVLTGYSSTAIVTDDKRIRVTIQPTGQIIPFAVSHPEDPSVRSLALIWVPGSAESVPQLDATAPPLVVASGAALTIDLDERIVTASGAGVRLTDSSTVQATHANGDPLVVDDDTLRFVSAEGYSGPASISFEVTDGETADDPDGRTAVLVLPLTVLPRADQPPVFTGAAVEVEPAQERRFDLTKLTDFARDATALRYSVVGALPVDFSYRLTGSTLTVRADEDAAVGSTTGVTISVTDGQTTGQSGRIALTVVASTRPLVQPIADSVAVPRGTTTDVRVLANDESTNPFPGQPLTLVSLTDSTLPSGVSVEPDLDRGILRVSVGADAAAVDTTVQYRVGDASEDPSRYAYGSVRISVQDVPATPDAPVRQADSFVSGELKLRITPPAQNNSPITGYRIVSSSRGEYVQDCGLSLICSLTGLSVGAEYRFSVVATNELGDSNRSPVSEAYSIDYRPAAPATVTAAPSPQTDAPQGKSITVSWANVPDPDPGTAVVGYVVEITGPGVDFSAAATSPFTTTAGGALVNDASYSVAVYARNKAQVLSNSEWKRTTTTVRTVGPPSAPAGGPTARLESTASGAINIAWGRSDPNGAGAVTYSIGRFTGTPPTLDCSPTSKPELLPGATGVSSPWTDTTAVDGRVYTYVVYVDNGLFCTSAATGSLESKAPPGPASGAVTTASQPTGQFDLVVAGDLSVASGTASRFEYSFTSNGGWLPLPADGRLTSIADASHYGTPTTVYFRGCRDDGEDYCGAASEGSTATPVDARAGVQSCVQLSPVSAVPPVNPGPIESVTYQYSFHATSTDVWSEFGTDDVVPIDTDGVRVRATVVVDGTPYTDEGYGEGTCSTP